MSSFAAHLRLLRFSGRTSKGLTFEQREREGTGTDALRPRERTWE
jgi:hypothetical protein